MPSLKTQLSVSGLKDLEKTLSELPKATARSVMIRVLRKEGQIVADTESLLAPKLTGELALSPSVGTKLTRRQRRSAAKESDVEVYVGPTPHPKSVQTEFGNAHQKAEPHLRPAWDATWRTVLDGIKQSLADEIEKSRARLAKKAERLAAKMKSQS